MINATLASEPRPVRFRLDPGSRLMHPRRSGAWGAEVLGLWSRFVRDATWSHELGNYVSDFDVGA